MAVYLGNQHIKDLYFGETKIAEAYFGSVKVYPESASGELIFKIIFTDSEGNTYDQLAFRNISTQQISSLNFRSTDLANLQHDVFTDFGTINNNTITLNRQEFYQSINSGGQYLIYIDENDNRLISVSYFSDYLQGLTSGNTIYETEIDINDITGDTNIYWEWYKFNIASGYELVGRKNGTGDVITICSDGDESKVSLSKSTIQDNIIRLYLDFDGTTTPIENELAIVMEPSLGFGEGFTTPNGLTLKMNDIVLMSQLEYDNYLNEDGFYPLTFIISDSLSIWEAEYGNFAEGHITESGSIDNIPIPNANITIYDTADYNITTGAYKSSSDIYYLRTSLSSFEEDITPYLGHSIGRVGMVDSKGKEYKFEFRIPSTPPQ